MNELSKLLQIKEYVLEIKLNLAKLHTQKEEAISFQYYEKASELRDKERGLHKVLDETRKILIDRKLPPLPTSNELKEYDLLLTILSEINFDSESKMTYKKLRNDLYELLELEMQRLIRDKKELQKEREFWAVNELHRQLLEIGNFLSNVGK